MKKLAIFTWGCLLLAACNNSGEEKCEFIPETGSIQVNLQFESLEDSLPAITSKEQLVHFLTVHPDIRDVFLDRQSYPSDSIFINALFQRFTNPSIDTLLMETHRVFGGGHALKKEFEQAFTNLKYYYPNFQPPRIKTIITGLDGNSDLFVSDSLVIVGLDYFLGESAKYRPDMFSYMLRRYNKDFIVPSVLLISSVDGRFNKTDPSDRIVLADMIGYGKAYYFTKRMLPCTPDSILIGYTRQEIEGSRQYENMIWSRLVEDQVLYATSHIVKQKYISERPKTIEVGEDCPGRIGQWVGWQMVKKYMDTHPDTKLPQLMAMQNASKLFKESGYKPQVVKVPGKEKN
jgi:hypothetical protein